MKQEKNKNLIFSLLVKLLSHSEDHEQYVGDIEELYYIHKERIGSSRATLYLLGQLLRSIPFFIFSSVYWGAAMFKNYFTIAFRNLLKWKSYSFINITGLAIGITCSLFILGYVQDELSYDKSHENADELYLATFASNGSISTPTALGEFLKSEYPEIVRSSRFSPLGKEYLKYGEVSAFQN